MTTAPPPSFPYLGPPPPAGPHRMTPTDALAVDILGAIDLLGPVVCTEELERVCRSRPVLVRAAIDLLLDLGRVAPHPSGCFVLTTPRSAA